MLTAGAATLARTAAVGENRGDALTGDEVADLGADFLDDAGYLVAEDEALLDAAPELPPHDGDVVVADAGGGDLDEGITGAGARRLDLLEAEAVGRPGLLQYDGFHGGAFW